MVNPHRCACGCLAKVGTPGTVKIRFKQEERPSEVTVESPMCTCCIVAMFEDKGSTGTTGAKPFYNTRGKPVGPAKRLGANSRSKKWLGRR